MFGRKNKTLSDIDTLIGSGAVITGDVQFDGGLRVDGRIFGNVIAAENKQYSILVLSAQGVVEGKLKVPHMIIDGTVKGPIHANENLELQPGARITGDIHYKIIKIHPGAAVEGKLIQLESPQLEKLITFVATTADPEKQEENTE